MNFKILFVFKSEFHNFKIALLEPSEHLELPDLIEL